jgi:hypothetical protein
MHSLSSRGLLLLLWTLAASIPACAANDAPSDEGDDDAEITTGRFANRGDLFGADMLYVRVTGWDSNRMTPAVLKDAQTVNGAELAVFTAKPETNVHCPDAEATGDRLVYQTKKFSLRTSGNLTNGTPKSSYKVGLEAKSDRLFGMSALNLKSMWNDVSQMREALAWRMFDQVGVRAPRHTYAKFCINGRYYGLYSVIEQIDKSFLKDRFGDNDEGNLYKTYWPTKPGGGELDVGPASLEHRRDSAGDDSGKQYWKNANPDDRTYQLKTNDKSDDPRELQTYDDLAAFIRTLNRVGERNASFDTDEYASAMESTFDVKGFLRWASVNSLVGAWDNYWATPANYYVYNAGRRGAKDEFMAKPYWSWLPWDYDNTFGIDYFNARWQDASIVDWPSSTRPYYQGRTTAKLPLLTNVLANTKFLRYYLDCIEHVNETMFTDTWITKQIGDERSGLRRRVQTAAYLEADGPSVPPHTGRQFTNDEVYRHGFVQDEMQRGAQKIEGIVHFVRMRHDAVARELARLRAKHPKGSSGARFPAEPTPIP